jgi:hypothetical protein
MDCIPTSKRPHSFRQRIGACLISTDGKGRPTWQGSPLLGFAVALVQHHDGITGTQKAAVTQDYADWLLVGMEAASKSFVHGLHTLLHPAVAAATAQASATQALAVPAGHADRAQHMHRVRANQDPSGTASAVLPTRINSSAAGQLPALQQCFGLNISVCELSVRLSATSPGLMVVAYNALAWSRRANLRIPVSSPKRGMRYKVTGEGRLGCDTRPQSHNCCWWLRRPSTPISVCPAGQRLALSVHVLYACRSR